MKHVPDIVVDRAAIVAPPPVIYLGMLGLGLFLEWIWPTPDPARSLAVGMGSVILACGVTGVAITIHVLRGARTPVDPYKPTTALVTHGLFRFSRNPIYVSNLLIYIGLSLVLRAGWALALIPVLIWMLCIGVIMHEERYLEDKFGEDYLRYKRKVRRWL